MFGLLRTKNLEYINFIKNENIQYANVTERLPFADNSCDVVYSSHMLEHINPADVPSFLQETHRVLKPNGIVRIAVPDLMRKTKDYLASGDADEFMRDTLLGEFWSQATSFRGRVRFALVGDPSAHKWMYDGMSLAKLLEQHNFTSCKVMPDGETQIDAPGELDLYERSPESVFVEGRK
ncbi:class I SAM-dependent methyltransferase [Neorhodopirellula pilleata]|uniref:Methyltransferase type 11 domain-containing protein n=1 Tax=Neorhodopirellula pilleata TaxID=2714738 RepID=A0A5C6AAE3_9BACT|nr:methyltransferase domain-containing protein [Neorhodopirellula pilleata]TWT96278.1 hypothetical protein Pla100_27550 [Neorhodopirellula pilleata]